MSERNIELVRRYIAAFNARDVEAAIALCDPSIEYVNPIGAIEPGIRRGLPAFNAAVEKLFEGWEKWEMEPEQFTAVGNQVAVLLHYQARVRQSGIEVEGRESAL